jgi:hypothetical protein
LVVTSANYDDAYMRSGWASRFLFDLCRDLPPEISLVLM